MINTPQLFDPEKNPLIGGIDINNLISILSMTTKGGAYTTLVSPDIVWFHIVSNLSSVNGEPISENQGINISGFSYAVADIKLEDIGRCVIRPWFWNGHALDWFSGSSVCVYGKQRLKTAIDGAEKFYIEILEFQPTGVNPKINVLVSGTSI